MSRRSSFAPIGSVWWLPIVPRFTPGHSYFGATPEGKALVLNRKVAVFGYGKKNTVICRMVDSDQEFVSIGLVGFLVNARPMNSGTHKRKPSSCSNHRKNRSLTMRNQ